MTYTYPHSIDGTDGRTYYLNDDGTVESMERIDYEAEQAEALALIYAEFGSSWVHGGGRVEDVGQAFRMHHPELCGIKVER